MKKRMLSWLFVLFMVISMVIFMAPDTLAASISPNEIPDQPSTTVQGSSSIDERLRGGTRTWNVPLDIKVSNITKTEADQSVTVFSRYDDNHYQYESPWTYVFNQPVNITVENCKAPRFSLISDGMETNPSVRHNFVKYVFNAPVTLNITGSTFTDMWTQTHGKYWVGLGYTQTVMTNWGVEFNDTYTINLKDSSVTGNMVCGVEKSQVRGNPDRKGDVVTTIRSDWSASMQKGVTVNLNNSSVFGSLTTGHKITETSLESNVNKDDTENYFFNGDAVVNVNNDSWVSSIVPSQYSSANTATKKWTNLNGNLYVNVDRNSQVSNLINNDGQMYGSAKSVTLDTEREHTDVLGTIEQLVHVDQIRVGARMNVNNMELADGGMKIDIKNPANWNTGDVILENLGSRVDQSKVTSNWKHSNITMNYTESNTQQWKITVTPGAVNVTFDPDGGEINRNSAPVVVSGKAGTALTLPDTPTREGYTFEGWYSGKNGSGSAVPSAFPDSASTYYAKWTKVPEYTVTFDPGDGLVDGQNTPYSVTGRAGNTIYVPKAEPNQTGKAFDGWYKDPENATGKLPDNAKFTENATYKARYIDAQITLVFSNNHSNSNKQYTEGTMKSMSWSQDQQNIALPKVTYKVKDKYLADYRFWGWIVNNDVAYVSRLVYQDQSVIEGNLRDKILQAYEESEDGTVTLYAVWELRPRTVAIFNMPSGYNKNEQRKSLYYPIAGMPDKDPDTMVMEPSGLSSSYVFSGWKVKSTNPAGNEGKFTFIPKGTTVLPRGISGVYTVDYEAVITRTNVQYNVTFDAGDTTGGKLEDGHDHVQKVTGLKTMRELNLDVCTPTPNSGYKFAGWRCSLDEMTYETEGVLDYQVIDHVTFTAQWQSIADVEVTFNPDGGTWNDQTTNVKTVSAIPGAVAAVPGTVTRPGYEFTGWKSDNNAYGDLGKEDTQTPALVAGQAVNYTAQWKPKTYTIHYSSNHQDDATGTVQDQTYVFDTTGETLTRDVYTSPTRNLLGWSLNSADNTASYQPGAGIDEALKNAMIASDDNTVTLYAIWTDKDAVTMKFDAGEGTFDDGSNEKTKLVQPGKQKDLPAAPSRTGFVFDGWKSGNESYPDLSKDDTTTPIAQDGKNVVYTAKWKEIYNVTFSAGQKGSFVTENDPLSKQQVVSGETVTGVPAITVRGKWKFSGWQINGSGKVYTNAEVLAAIIKKDTRFVASYSYTGGTGGSGNGDSKAALNYIIKAYAGKGGTISSSGNVSVARGNSKTFTISASDGYEISDVCVDGRSVGAVKEYTFTNVRKHHTIAVIFKH